MIISVKGGSKLNAVEVRDLIGTMEKERQLYT